jgi:hypothetical protein
MALVLADWENITPEELIPAVKYIRESFDESGWKCSELTRKLCYSALHPGAMEKVALAPYEASFVIYRRIMGQVAQRTFDHLLHVGTPPSFFLAYLNAFRKGLETEVRRLFDEVLQIGLANPEALKIHPVEWARAHLRILIAANSHRVVLWIKSVCDKQETWKPIDTDDNSADKFLWKTWRAPRLVHMQPSGNTPFEPVSAWMRENGSATEKLLSALSDRFVMSLEFALDKIAGDAHVACAKKSGPKMQVKQPPPQHEGPRRAPEIEPSQILGPVISRITSISLVDPGLTKLGLEGLSLDLLAKESGEHLFRLLEQWEEQLQRLRQANPEWQPGGTGTETEADYLMTRTYAAVKQLKSALALRNALPRNTEVGSKPKDALQETGPFTHSPDYRSVTIRGKTHSLTPRQAQVIQILHEAHESGNPEVSHDFILEKMETNNSRWQDTFKSNRIARNALIRVGKTRGTLRLNL